MNTSRRDIAATLRALTEGRIDAATAAMSLSAVVLVAQSDGRAAGIREAAEHVLKIASELAGAGELKQANTIGVIAEEIANLAPRIDVGPPRDAFT